MSTSHHIENEQKASPWTAPPISGEQDFSVQTPPQLPQKPPRPRGNRWVVVAAVLLALALVLSLSLAFLPGLISHPAGQVTPTPTTPVTPTQGPEISPTPSQGIHYGPQACPAGIGSPAHWDAILGTGGSGSKVAAVSCANVLGNPSLQALVTVRHSDANSTLDVYVFNNITSAKPAQLFKLSGLIKGDAKISYYNSLMTAQVDPNSSLNVMSKDASEWSVDLYREFAWDSAQGKLVQVAFPGIFPDLTRYEAEADQALVNKGQQTWKNDAAQVAKALAGEKFNWTRALSAKVLSGGGSQDVSATVQVQEAPLPGGPKQSPSATVKLSRLEGNPHNLWEVIAVQDGTDALTNIPARSLIASPVQLQGKGSAFEGVIGHAYIWDRQSSPVGYALLTGTPGMGNASYAIATSYVSSFKAGPTEGFVQVVFTSPVEADPYAMAMVKVLLDPHPVVVSGPVSCPLVTQLPGYWPHVLGLDTTSSTVGTVSCANLKGDLSLQALVPVSYTNGKPSEVYVYDRLPDDNVLTGPQPVQIFKLQTQQANISGVSTITTKDGDLSREFKWSGKAGTFVQVAFPGFFPDMTRWQAEESQLAVMGGQESWRLDAVKTTQHWSLLGGTAKLAKGGGAGDLTAVVNVTFPTQEGTTNIPVTQVTLSRLEGNPTGIWEITAVQSNGMFIYTPESGATVSSPVTVTGFGPQYEAQVGVVYILDRLYQQIQVGTNFAMLPDGSSPPARFSLDVKYTSSTQAGVQEGIVELVHTSGASFDRRIVMVKVLLNP
jgi:hypothetical protein